MTIANDYKLSKYNIDIDDNGQHYIFNLNSGALIEVDQNEIDLFKSSQFDLLSTETCKELENLNILIRSEINEFELLSQSRKEINLSRNRQFDINIMTTTKCNARCYYCYEKDMSNKKHMPEETVEQLIEYILSKYDGRIIHLKWFGGEPLCNKSVISKICNKLKSLNIKYYSTMISNGLYVGKYLDKIMNEWNMKRVQITLDGIGDKYNIIKNYYVWKGQNHFNILIKNIHELINNRIFVSIRLNFNPVDPSDCLSLLDFLYDEFGNNKYLNVYCSHIYDDNLPLPNELNPNPYVIIYEKLISLGYVKTLLDLRVIRSDYYCGIKNKEFVTVDPDGNLFKCEHEACHGKDNAFFNIFNDETEINTYNLDLWEKDTTQTLCEECICYPICNGGCRYYELHGQNNSHCIQIKNCINDILKFFIKMRKE